MTLSAEAAALREKLSTLAHNLYWTWQADLRGLLNDLDAGLWHATNHNPVAVLQRLPEPRWEALAADPVLHRRVDRALQILRGYVGDGSSWGERHAGPLRVRPVAYFCAEFGLHECLPVYSGGMGVLAGDHLKSASDLGIPMVGVGLFYREGYFHQTLDREGRQGTEYTRNDPGSMPLTLVREEGGRPLEILVRTPYGHLAAQIWEAAVGRNRLFLLDADIEANGEEARALSRRLYGGDQELRLRQEILLGIGGVHALEAMGVRPSVLHLNEGHCALALLRMSRGYMKESDCSFDEAFREVSSRTVFTTHTPVAAGHDWFPPDLVEFHLATFRESLGLSRDAFLDLGRFHPGKADDGFCMTILALRAAHRTNAVSSANGRVSRRMWTGLWPGRTEDQVPIGHVTNGVHVDTWLAPEMRALFHRVLGPDWPRRLSHADFWARLDQALDAEVWSVHEMLRIRLIQFVRRRLDAQCCSWGSPEEERLEAARVLDPRVLTVGFARRFAPYKRATLLLSDKERFRRLVANAERPVQFIFSGKAHPNDGEGQEMVRQIVALTREEGFRGRVVFVGNYDLHLARQMVQGVDLWMNLPRRPLEACGTSGQKAAMNGVLNLSTLDGWWPEGWDGMNGFALPAPDVPPEGAAQDAPDARSLFAMLEDEVVPLFYRRDENGIPRGWVFRMKRSIRTLIWRFNSDRMVMDYVRDAYLSASGAASHAPRSL